MGGPAPRSPGHPWYPESIDHDGHSEKPQTGYEKGHRGASPGDDEASQRRCDDACPLPNGGVQGHSAEHDPAIDQMGIEGLAGRLVERFNRACAKSDDQDVPHLNNLEEGESPQQEDEASREALSGHDQATLIDGVGKNPTKQVQANGWDTTGDTHVSQGQRGTRQLVDQPVLAEA